MVQLVIIIILGTNDRGSSAHEWPGGRRRQSVWWSLWCVLKGWVVYSSQGLTKGTLHLRLGHVTQRVSWGEAVITLATSDDATAFSGAVTTPVWLRQCFCHLYLKEKDVTLGRQEQVKITLEHILLTWISSKSVEYLLGHSLVVCLLQQPNGTKTSPIWPLTMANK